jgi:pSer/pThr/pTyr-binding forkhead associated (FHA) protein
MDILSKARKVESKLARTLDRALQQWAKSGPLEPLETLHAVVEAVEARLEPVGRGRYVFPFNKVKVSIAAGTRDIRARFAAVLEGDGQLQERITNRLRDAGCDPAPLQLSVSYAARPGSDWPRPEFHVEFERVTAAEPPSAQHASALDLRITITHGSTERPGYTFSIPRINIGRGAEVRDSRNRLIRTNHVVFTDADRTTNDTVSRRHAHIDCTDGSADYRISDDRSAHGTSILRDGRTIEVPSGSRGIRLQTGDEIVLGEARARVKISKAP